MGTEPMTAEVSAALARTRRRARYLEAAEPGWMHLLSAAISVAIGIYLIGSSDAEVSRGTVGLVMILRHLEPGSTIGSRLELRP